MKKELNKIYVVTNSDNIDKIAKKYNKNPIEILILNCVTPNMIKKGQVLVIND